MSNSNCSRSSPFKSLMPEKWGVDPKTDAPFGWHATPSLGWPRLAAPGQAMPVQPRQAALRLTTPGLALSCLASLARPRFA